MFSAICLLHFLESAHRLSAYLGYSQAASQPVSGTNEVTNVKTTPTIREMASQLIASPSISSTEAQYDMSNEAVIDQLANWLSPLGFDVHINPIEGRPGKSNLIATLGEGTGGLVLSGHSDTVPIDEALWQTDPFTLTEKDDRWYGIGSCDMKSFFAMVIDAVANYVDTPFAAPLTILATADEESSMSGARALTAADVAGARFALIGEPTDLSPVNRHKGIMMLKATLQGSSGHSSNPDLGVNALDATAELINQLVVFRDELRQRFTDNSFEVAFPSLNLGCIHGGDNPNRICDHVGLSFDVRILPSMQSDAVIEELQQRLQKAFHNHAVNMDLAMLNPYIDPFANDDTELLKMVQQLGGGDPGPVGFATEAPFLSKLGLETLVMGAGSIDQAHQPNEILPLNQIDPAVAIIRGLIEKVCLAKS